MESTQQGMKRKWERHFRTSKSAFGYAIIIIGATLTVVLLFLWPQYLLPLIFNSRSGFRAIISSEDYFTCHDDFVSFMVDEPLPQHGQYSFYVFNVSNAAEVVQRGFKPAMTETGPFAYTKYSYKYDLKFPLKSSDLLQYKEYSSLHPIENPNECVRMFYRMDRADSLIDDPCVNGGCECEDVNVTVTTINPLFLKLSKQETTQQIVAQYSGQFYSDIVTLLEKDFVSAVRSHLVSNAYEEVYLFRQQMQIYYLFNTSLQFMLTNHSLKEVATLMEARSRASVSEFKNTQCGLGIYGITSCPLSFYDTAVGYKASFLSSYNSQHGVAFNSSNFPSISKILDSTNHFSVFDVDNGLPVWLGLTWCLGYLDFNFLEGYTMINKHTDCPLLLNETIYNFAFASFGSVTTDEYLGTEVIVKAFTKYIESSFITPYLDNALADLVHEEFLHSEEIVTCSPNGYKCVWQWNHASKLVKNNFKISDDMVNTLLNYGSRSDNNPNHMYYSGNTASFYNAYKYCSAVLYPSVEQVYHTATKSNCEFPAYDYTVNDGRISHPAGFFAVDYNISLVNSNALEGRFQNSSEAVQMKYLNFSCSIATLLFGIFPNTTVFHDEFVVRYLNKHKDPHFSHNFTREQDWKDLGYAQFGGGFVTYALAEVQSS
jgi:hypothetical protein